MQRTLQLRRNILGLVLISLLVLAPGLSAPSAAYEPVDAEKLIKGCWDISEEKRSSGATGTMRHGAAITLGCMEKVIVDQSKAIFDPKYMSPEKIQKHLDQIQIGTQKIYWALYNGHDRCPEVCGTMNHLLHLPPNIDVLEQIIRDIARERNQNKIEDRRQKHKQK
jgi:hypothetical protein